MTAVNINKQNVFKLNALVQIETSLVQQSSSGKTMSTSQMKQPQAFCGRHDHYVTLNTGGTYFSKSKRTLQEIVLYMHYDGPS